MSRNGFTPLNGDRVSSITPAAVMTAVVVCTIIVVGVLIAASVGASTIKDVRNVQHNPCSSMKAFGTPGTAQGGESNPSPREIIVNRSTHLIDTVGYTGLGFSLRLGNEETTHYQGLANIDNDTPWSENTLVRMTTQSKTIGASLFLAYSFRHNVHTDQRLSSFIPAFANTKVLQPYHPTYLVTEANPISTTNTLTTVTVTTTNPHGLSTGNLVSITGVTPDPLSGIPTSEINKIHTITVTGANTFTFTSTTAATATAAAIGGATVKIALVVAGVKVTVPYVCLPTVYYYTEAPLLQPILMKHVLEKSMGWVYYPYTPFGCAQFVLPSDPLYESFLIQSQLFVAAGVGYGFDFHSPTMPTVQSGISIQTWANLAAQVPLMFQPGEDWTSGPVTNLIGAVLEIADANPAYSTDLPPKARTADVIMKEEIFDPLDMKDSMYYIQDADPRRTDLISRLTQIYLAYTSIPFSSIVAAFLPFELAAYDATAPRTTIMLDTALLSTPGDQRKFFDMLARGGTTPSGRRLIGKDMIAEMSQTQNKFFRSDRGAESYISHSRGTTWGLGTVVPSETSASLGLIGGFESNRAISFAGFIGCSYGIDFQHDIRFLTFTQSIPANIVDTRRVIHAALGARKCMDPGNHPILNAVV